MNYAEQGGLGGGPKYSFNLCAGQVRGGGSRGGAREPAPRCLDLPVVTTCGVGGEQGRGKTSALVSVICNLFSQFHASH